jgi:hypothetical protein
MHAKNPVILVVTIVGLAGAAVPLRAQSLGEVARKEEERRKTIKHPAKVLTNKDLGPAPAVSAATPPPPPDSSSATSSTTADTSSTPKEDKSKDQAYWSGRKKGLQTQLDRDQTYADALQSRINALTTDFVNRDDPAQREVIRRDREKAMTEAERLKQSIQATKKAIADLEEEARRAGVPPGWLR